ncbi:uncharacterized protein CCOS01_08488 [Colletotrichum costaricense]|uniref:Uncharacterized protein n=1 Tax=Colletotrichum costaricense TaxID=1209916 RepID=A0AAI9YVX7_9PEZI|nr:uncharacterized protein CCOS01_08488 [Colletotrichum costaricense]KAK1526070.1 hypothetical protein CCOS01_08488 [Colletotrichum costaricense]
MLRVTTGRSSAPDGFRKWRSSYLKSLLGRRPLPERAVTPAPPLSIHNDVDRPQFAWEDNLHLVRDDFSYLMRAPSRHNWDTKVLDLIDTRGRHHTLSYGLGAVEGCRVEKWRTQTIDNVLRSFRVVFGMTSGLANSSARLLEQIVRTFDTSAAIVPLRRLVDQVQAVVCARTASSLRLEVAGPNFFNFFLTAVTKDPSLREHFLRLNWTERVDKPFSRQSRLELLHALVRSHVENYQGQDLSLPGHLYSIWIRYCNFLLDTPFPDFRKKIIAHEKTWKLLEQFAEPANSAYRWGDYERGQTRVQEAHYGAPTNAFTTHHLVALE